MLLILLGSYEDNWLIIIRFHCVFEKVGHVSSYKMYNMTFPCPPWTTQKNSVSFLLFSMSECIYVALAPCSVVHVYIALIFVQGAYMSAIFLKFHALPFSCFCIQHRQFIFWCCHHTLYLLYLLFLIVYSVMWRNLAHVLFCHPALYLEQPSPMQTVVYCFPNLTGPGQMPHSFH